MKVMKRPSVKRKQDNVDVAVGTMDSITFVKSYECLLERVFEIYLAYYCY